jgi:hypothetical protein
VAQLRQKMLGELQGQKSLRLCLAWLRIRGYVNGSRPRLVLGDGDKQSGLARRYDKNDDGGIVAALKGLAGNRRETSILVFTKLEQLD